MTQEEKQLLLTDLCARLPYKVNCEFRYKEEECTTFYGFTIKVPNLEYKTENKTLNITDLDLFSEGDLEIKPYLRSEDDVTEEESAYLRHRFCFEWGGKSLVELINNHKIDICDSIAFVNWLYEHHFDLNGLIDNRLAYKAPNGMYNINRD